ncbi:MAG: NAD(P)-dependent oxidoreductase [Kineosporiaceae bacterium]
MAGLTLGVIGCGAIGRRVAGLGAALGMRVVVYDAVPDPDYRPAADITTVGLAALIERADVISLHCPPGTRPLVDAAFLAQARRGAVLINTARAGLVDHDAVEQALEAGVLGGFATDVYPSEPPRPTSLLRRDDVICTPHSGGNTTESVTRATRQAVENLLTALRR